jgi:hypothetical protein
MTGVCGPYNLGGSAIPTQDSRLQAHVHNSSKLFPQKSLKHQTFPILLCGYVNHEN